MLYVVIRKRSYKVTPTGIENPIEYIKYPILELIWLKPVVRLTCTNQMDIFQQDGIDIRIKTKLHDEISEAVFSLGKFHTPNRWFEWQRSCFIAKGRKHFNYPEIYKDVEKFELKLKQMILEDQLEALP